MPDVRYGSLADIGVEISDVRFTPESGHVHRRNRCLLCAISGHHGESVTRSRVSARPKRSNMSDRHVCKHDADQIEQGAESLRD